MYCQTLLDSKNLKTLYKEDNSILSSFTTYIKEYILSVYGNKYPISQTSTDLKIDFDHVYNTFVGWLSDRNQLMGLDIDMGALLTDETKNYESPDTSPSSENTSSRSTYTRPHTDSYFKYLGERLAMDPSLLDLKFEKWMSSMWLDVGVIMTGKRCYY